jgi:hypothetical protein
MAMSACCTSRSADDPGAASAIPMLASTFTIRPSSATGAEISAPTRRATPSASTASVSSTANSSPPSRAHMSSGRTLPRNRAATTRSSSSPAMWPNRSLIALKSSRSMNSSARCRSGSAMANSRAAVNAARLARPVSPSSCACAARSWCAALVRRASSAWLVMDCMAATASGGTR